MKSARTFSLGVLGAILGGGAGYFLVTWLAQQGWYALLVAPAAVGFGASLLARARSVPLAVICAALGLCFGLYIEWKFHPFIADGSFGYFLGHLHELRAMTLLILVVGAVIAYRMGLGVDRAKPAEATEGD